MYQMQDPNQDSNKKPAVKSLVDIFEALKKKEETKVEVNIVTEMPMMDPQQKILNKAKKIDNELFKKIEDNDNNESDDVDDDDLSQPSLPEESDNQDKPEETKEDNLMYGLTYDEYKKKVNVLGNKLKQCGYCLKFFKNVDKGFITKNLQGDEGEMICYHCLFWVNYSIDLRGSVDGLYEKTIHDYILECESHHDQDTCTHKGECFVCDYLNGTRITGIFGEDELFSAKNTSDNFDEMRFTISL